MATRGEKTRFDEIMSYLGDVEEEFSQMISNRSMVMQESPAAGAAHMATPGKSRLGMMAGPASAMDESSFIGSNLGGDEPREAYKKVRERLMELEIEKEEQEKQLNMLKQLRQKERTEAHK